MDAFLWIMLPVLVAAGSAILSYYIMQARMEVAIAREREAAATMKAQLEAIEQKIEDKVKAAEESAQRKAFDQFLLDFRVEERHYVRESRSHLLTRKSMIMQERLYFRNIPLSNWVEHEMPIEEGNLERLPAESSVFSARALSEHSKNNGPKFLPQ
ncbi:MAG TPA: hypothetical protein VE621_15695 [Bryobacteraceae bacterium]|jgi:hypothetical protein|nr:hypothetical protein [Bryobacteraceae bacterium]